MAHRAFRTNLISRLRSSRAKHFDSAQGFTIVELTIVIVVIAILATIVTVSYNGITRSTLEAAMQADLNTASTDLTADRWARGEYPADASVLNDGYGLKASGDNVLAYTKYGTGYCVSVTNPGTPTVFSLSSGSKKILKEACEEGAAPGDPEDPGDPIAGFPSQQIAKLGGSSGGGYFSEFGYAVDIDGDTAIVSAPWEKVGSTNYGSTRIYIRSGSTWTQQFVFQPTSIKRGSTVAIDGDTAVIVDSTYIKVFIRSGTTWTEQATLSPNPYIAGDKSVAIDGDTIVVGAQNSSDRSAFYIFTRSGSTWTQEFSRGPSVGIDLGSSVAIDGDTVLVGARKAADATYLGGAAYVYTRSWGTWAQQATLTASDASGNQYFGSSVALSGDTALVGAPGLSSDTGAGYVFTRTGSNWTQQAKITPHYPLSSSRLGSSVALSGNTALLGAPGLTSATGAAYVFTRSDANWIERTMLQASDGANNSYFGSSVAFDGSTALVGAPGSYLTRIGASYFFVP